jgi:hypothetical protein
LAVSGGRSSIGGFSIWRSFPWYFGLRFQEVILLILIYSSESSVYHLGASFIRDEIIGFGSFRRVQLKWRIQHLEEFPLVFRFEISGGDSTHLDINFSFFSIEFGGL